MIAEKISFAASTAEVAHGEKSRIQSTTHPAYLLHRESKFLGLGKLQFLH